MTAAAASTDAIKAGPDLLPEDADERRMFEDRAASTGVSPLEMVVITLTTASRLSPPQGSYAKLMAICANEVAKAEHERRVPAAHPADEAGFVRVPRTALAWLDGLGPDADGKWFGDETYPNRLRHIYWWRSVFRKMIEDAEAAPSLSEPRKGGG